MENKNVTVLLSNVVLNKLWLYDGGIPQNIHSRLSPGNIVIWHHHEPSDRHPLVEHRHYVPSGLRQELREWVYSPVRKIKALVKSDWKKRIVQPGERIISYDNSIQRLLSIAKETGMDYIALVEDNNVAIFPESVQYAVNLARKMKVDILYSAQVEGLIPVVVSPDFLHRWLEQVESPNPVLLQTPQALENMAEVAEVKFFAEEELGGKFRCSPMDAREKRLQKFWEEMRPKLREALSQTPEVPGPGRQLLQKILIQYRGELAAGLETYRVIGTLYDVNELRQNMMTTSKPLTDYFVVATHYGLFLQKFADLKPNSHVVDIGCSWGYLGFALANFLNKDGAYLGVEVQSEATKWSKERLGWLGENFQFVHLDIYNDYYNPKGGVPRSQVNLPIPDEWANVMIAGSVFTHMLEDGVQGYLHEICRVLAPGGVAAFSYDDSTYWGSSDEESVVDDKKMPDKTTYYSRNKIREMAEKAGLRPAREPVNMRQFDRTDFQTWYFVTRK